MFSSRKDILTLVARLIIGGIFIYAGWVKVTDMPATIQWFATMGISPLWTYVAAYAELIGGIFIVAGFYSQVAAGILGVVMLVAIYKSRAMGLEGFMPPLAVLAALVMILGNGAGSCSLGRCLPEKFRD